MLVEPVGHRRARVHDGAHQPALGLGRAAHEQAGGAGGVADVFALARDDGAERAALVVADRDQDPVAGRRRVEAQEMQPVGTRRLGLDGGQRGKADQRALHEVVGGGIIGALGHDPALFGHEGYVEGARFGDDVDARGVVDLPGEAGQELGLRGDSAFARLLPQRGDGEQKADERDGGEHREVAAAAIGEEAVQVHRGLTAPSRGRGGGAGAPPAAARSRRRRAVPARCSRRRGRRPACPRPCAGDAAPRAAWCGCRPAAS